MDAVSFFEEHDASNGERTRKLLEVIRTSPYDLSSLDISSLPGHQLVLTAAVQGDCDVLLRLLGHPSSHTRKMAARHACRLAPVSSLVDATKHASKATRRVLVLGCRICKRTELADALLPVLQEMGGWCEAAPLFPSCSDSLIRGLLPQYAAQLRALPSLAWKGLFRRGLGTEWVRAVITELSRQPGEYAVAALPVVAHALRKGQGIGMALCAEFLVALAALPTSFRIPSLVTEYSSAANHQRSRQIQNHARGRARNEGNLIVATLAKGYLAAFAAADTPESRQLLEAVEALRTSRYFKSLSRFHAPRGSGAPLPLVTAVARIAARHPAAYSARFESLRPLLRSLTREHTNVEDLLDLPRPAVCPEGDPDPIATLLCDRLCKRIERGSLEHQFPHELLALLCRRMTPAQLERFTALAVSHDLESTIIKMTFWRSISVAAKQAVRPAGSLFSGLDDAQRQILRRACMHHDPGVREHALVTLLKRSLFPSPAGAQDPEYAARAGRVLSQTLEFLQRKFRSEQGQVLGAVLAEMNHHLRHFAFLTPAHLQQYMQLKAIAASRPEVSPSQGGRGDDESADMVLYEMLPDTLSRWIASRAQAGLVATTREATFPSFADAARTVAQLALAGPPSGSSEPAGATLGLGDLHLALAWDIVQRLRGILADPKRAQDLFNAVKYNPRGRFARRAHMDSGLTLCDAYGRAAALLVLHDILPAEVPIIARARLLLPLADDLAPFSRTLPVDFGFEALARRLVDPVAFCQSVAAASDAELRKAFSGSCGSDYLVELLQLIALLFPCVPRGARTEVLTVLLQRWPWIWMFEVFHMHIAACAQHLLARCKPASSSLLPAVLMRSRYSPAATILSPFVPRGCSLFNLPPLVPVAFQHRFSAAQLRANFAIMASALARAITAPDKQYCQNPQAVQEAVVRAMVQSRAADGCALVAALSQFFASTEEGKQTRAEVACEVEAPGVPAPRRTCSPVPRPVMTPYRQLPRYAAAASQGGWSDANGGEEEEEVIPEQQGLPLCRWIAGIEWLPGDLGLAPDARVSHRCFEVAVPALLRRDSIDGVLDLLCNVMRDGPHAHLAGASLLTVVGRVGPATILALVRKYMLPASGSPPLPVTAQKQLVRLLACLGSPDACALCREIWTHFHAAASDAPDAPRLHRDVVKIFVPTALVLAAEKGHDAIWALIEQFPASDEDSVVRTFILAACTPRFTKVARLVGLLYRTLEHPSAVLQEMAWSALLTSFLRGALVSEGTQAALAELIPLASRVAAHCLPALLGAAEPPAGDLCRAVPLHIKTARTAVRTLALIALTPAVPDVLQQDALRCLASVLRSLVARAIAYLRLASSDLPAPHNQQVARDLAEDAPEAHEALPFQFLEATVGACCEAATVVLGDATGVSNAVHPALAHLSRMLHRLFEEGVDAADDRAGRLGVISPLAPLLFAHLPLLHRETPPAVTAALFREAFHRWVQPVVGAPPHNEATVLALTALTASLEADLSPVFCQSHQSPLCGAQQHTPCFYGHRRAPTPAWKEHLGRVLEEVLGALPHAELPLSFTPNALEHLALGTFVSRLATSLQPWDDLWADLGARVRALRFGPDRLAPRAATSVFAQPQHGMPHYY